MLNQEPTRAAGWRRPLKRWGTRLVLLLLAWFALTAIRIYVYGNKTHAATGDAAIVLGAGVGEGRPSPTPTSRYRTWRTKLPFLLRETWFYTTYLLRKLIL